MNLREGTSLQGGKYRIERELGHGGFGVTYLATQVGLNRRVAIKEFFMSEYCNRDADTSQVTVGSEGSKELVEKFRKKFIKEAQNIASLKHPHIISIHDVFEDNGTAYYVMEYLDHGSLADMVKRQGRLCEADALRYTRQIADALRYIHARKMNHLDVKPGNILVDEEGHAVLIDFGLSKRYDDEGNQTSTTPVGISHGYAPLEQYKKGGVGTFSPATDIYSLGATLYKLVTGTTPPDANDVNDDGLPPLPSYVSSATATAIEQAMQPRRKDRPQSIEEFMAFLDAEAKAEDERTVLLGPPCTTNVDCPVGFWALMPVAALMVSCLINIYGNWIGVLPGHSWDEYPFFASILFMSAYIVSGTLALAKMGKSRNKLSTICLYAWTCLMLFAYICHMFAKTYYVDIYGSGVVDITNFIAQIPLIAFLVMRLIKTSTYKLPLMVGIAGVVVRLISILACCFVHGLGMSSMPQSGWGAHLLYLIYYGYAILMVASFLMMFFASRKLEKQRALRAINN